jgi:hypothetical protein
MSSKISVGRACGGHAVCTSYVRWGMIERGSAGILCFDFISKVPFVLRRLLGIGEDVDIFEPGAFLVLAITLSEVSWRGRKWTSQ